MVQKMIKRNDIKLFAVIIVVAIIAIVAINLLKSEGSKVVVTIDGKVYKTLDLNTNQTFTIKQADGDYNFVKIENGSVSMTDANCPDKICVHHSSIHYNGETIVCLPHKVVVEITNGKENEVDITAQ